MPLDFSKQGEELPDFSSGGVALEDFGPTPAQYEPEPEAPTVEAKAEAPEPEPTIPGRRWVTLSTPQGVPMRVPLSESATETFTEPPMPFPRVPSVEEKPPTFGEKILANVNPVLPGAGLLLGNKPVVQAMRSVANIPIGVGEFMTTPLGAGTAAVGPAAPLATTAGFAAMSAADLGKQLGVTSAEWDQMTPSQRVDAAIGIGATAGFAALLSRYPYSRAREVFKRTPKAQWQGPVATGEVLRQPDRGVPTEIMIEAEPKPTPAPVAEEAKPAVVESPQKWFHGSHDNVREMSYRTVQNLDSLGTWVSGNKEYARSLYGPNVYEVEATPKNLLEAHTQNFDDFFFSNRNLFSQLFPDTPISTMGRFKEKGLSKSDPYLYGLRQTYLRAFRKMLQDAGYDGVLWKDSTIDLRKGEQPHDVAVLFHEQPISVKRVEAKPPPVTSEKAQAETPAPVAAEGEIGKVGEVAPSPVPPAISEAKPKGEEAQGPAAKEPLVIRGYHGGAKEIESFSKKLIGSNTGEGWLGEGFYFSPHADVAPSYGPKTTTVDITLKNPYRFPDDVNPIKFVKEHGGPKKFTEWVKYQGYDGIISENILHQIIAFEPEQIKVVRSEPGGPTAQTKGQAGKERPSRSERLATLPETATNINPAAPPPEQPAVSAAPVGSLEHLALNIQGQSERTGVDLSDSAAREAAIDRALEGYRNPQEAFDAAMDMVKAGRGAEETYTAEGFPVTHEAVAEAAKLRGAKEPAVSAKTTVSATGEKGTVAESATGEPAKQPWEMTRDEYASIAVDDSTIRSFKAAGDMESFSKAADQRAAFRDQHRKSVTQALREGKDIRPEVLADYPDLAKGAPTPVPSEAPVAKTAEKAAQQPTELFLSWSPKEGGTIMGENRRTSRDVISWAKQQIDALQQEVKEYRADEQRNRQAYKESPNRRVMGGLAPESLRAASAKGKKVEAQNKIAFLKSRIAEHERIIKSTAPPPSSVAKPSPSVSEESLGAGGAGNKRLAELTARVEAGEQLNAKERREYQALRDKATGTTQEEPPEVQAGAIALGSTPLMPIAPAPSLPPKAISQIIRDLAKGLSIPIRFGRLRTTKYSGYFKKLQNLIGAKRANDMPIVGHEVGHKLDATLGLSRDPTISAELSMLGDPATPGSMSSWTKSKSAIYRRGEGMAEFVRYWLTDPAQATRLAPNTHAAFEAALRANVDLEAVMRQAQRDVERWRTAEAQARLHSSISIGENPNKAHYTVSNLTRDLVDDLHFVRLAVDDAKASGAVLPSQNPYQLARLLRGAYGMADTFIRRGIVDFKSKSVQLGTGLEDALKPVSGRVNDFRDWIVAKRAQELHRRGKNTGLLPSDVDATAARYETDPAFNEAFARIKRWNDGMLQYAVDSGLVAEGTPATATSPSTGAYRIRELNQDYVPFHRIFEIGAGEFPAQEGAGTGRGLNVGKPGSLRGLKGSPRDIIDPLETMVKNAYSFITASEKNAINVALGDLANRQNMGKWVERIAIPKEAVRVEAERIRKQLEAAGADMTAVPDDLVMTFFRPSGRVPFGENVIRVNRGGQMEFYRLNKDLFDTFNALDAESSGKLIQLMAIPAQLLRAGVTLTPDFALSNALRDTMSAGVISRYGMTPFVSTIRGIANLLKNPQLVSEWSASGGRQAVEASYFDRAKLQRFLSEKITKDLTPAERALVVARNPFAALRYLTGLLEEGTRLGQYEGAYKKLVSQGMNPGEARRQAAFEARDLQDFAKGGAHTKVVRQVAAFWNAQLQANVRLAQSFKDRPFQTILKGLAFVTLPKLLEQAVNWNDEDYWDKPQWQRDLFYMIPIGKDENQRTRFMRIPIPFEVGLIFATVPGRFLQWGKQNAKAAFDEIVPLMLKQTVPVPTSFPAVPILEAAAGRQGYSYWRGKPIVPESLKQKPPELQVTEQTSLTARRIGRLLGLSPIKVDYLIGSYTGGLGRQLIHQGLDRGISAVSGEHRPSLSVVPFGRFIAPPSGSQSQAIERFYELLNEAEANEARAKAGQPRNYELNAKAMRRTADIIAARRKLAMNEKDPAKRQQHQLEMVRLAKLWVDRIK